MDKGNVKEFLERLEYIKELFEGEVGLGDRTIGEYTAEDMREIILSCSRVYTTLENTAVFFASVLKKSFPDKYGEFLAELDLEIDDKPTEFNEDSSNERPI